MRSTVTVARCLALLGILIVGCSPSAARAASAHIRVTDQHGARIPGATAFLAGPDHKPVRGAEANSDSVGEIVVTDLPLGNSRLIIHKEGFKDQPVTVTVHPDEEPRVEVVMIVDETQPKCAENAICL